MVTPLTPVAKTGVQATVPTVPTDEFENESITVSSDSYVDEVIIDFRNYVEGVFEIENSHASNGLTYSIFGTVDENEGSPPDSSDASWAALPNASDIAVAALATSVQSLSSPDRYAWIRIVMKRTSSGQSSAAKFYARCSQQ